MSQVEFLRTKLTELSTEGSTKFNQEIPMTLREAKLLEAKLEHAKQLIHHENDEQGKLQHPPKNGKPGY